MLLSTFFIANKAICKRTYCKITLYSGGQFEGYLSFEDDKYIEIMNGLSAAKLIKVNIAKIERKEIEDSSSPETYTNIIIPQTNSYFDAKKLYDITAEEKIGYEKYKLYLKAKKLDFLDALINEFHWDMTLSELENITNVKFSKCYWTFSNDKSQDICMKEVVIGDYKYNIYFEGDSKDFNYPTSIKIFPTVIHPTLKAGNYIGNFMSSIKQLELEPPSKDFSLEIPNIVVEKIGDKYIIYSTNINDDTIFIEKNISSDVQHRNYLVNTKPL